MPVTRPLSLCLLTGAPRLSQLQLTTLVCKNLSVNNRLRRVLQLEETSLTDFIMIYLHSSTSIRILFKYSLRVALYHVGAPDCKELTMIEQNRSSSLLNAYFKETPLRSSFCFSTNFLSPADALQLHASSQCLIEFRRKSYIFIPIFVGSFSNKHKTQ